MYPGEGRTEVPSTERLVSPLAPFFPSFFPSFFSPLPVCTNGGGVEEARSSSKQWGGGLIRIDTVHRYVDLDLVYFRRTIILRQGRGVVICRGWDARDPVFREEDR